MKQIQQNNFCLCGHLESVHGNSLGIEWCEYSRDGYYRHCEIDCQKYKRDNLRYLEQKYEEKTTEA